MLVWIGIIGGMTGLVSVLISWMQWRRVSREIVMLDDIDRARRILPTWYTDRMMRDYWLFGLLTTDGRTIAITNIKRVSADGRWMDVDLAPYGEFSCGEEGEAVVHAVAKDRTEASIQISNIVAAIELVAG